MNSTADQTVDDCQPSAIKVDMQWCSGEVWPDFWQRVSSPTILKR